jgi:glucose-6-phosphate isomerase
VLIALFERAVGLYATLVNINAYHQPGVEAGKKAATAFLKLMGEVRAALKTSGQTAEQIAATLAADPEDVYHLLNHLESNDQADGVFGEGPATDLFSLPG